MRPQDIDQKTLYIRQLFGLEDIILSDQKPPLYKAGMQIGSDEAAILQFLISISGTRKIVEIGTLVGYSTIAMAKALPDDGHIFTLEKSSERAAVAQDNFRKNLVDDKITLLEGDAMANLTHLVSSDKGPFDMIFIDADKGGYCRYLDWAESNIREGGIIIGDNSLLFDNVYKDQPDRNISRTSWQVMRDFNKRLADRQKYLSAMIPTLEGMTIAIKNF